MRASHLSRDRKDFAVEQLVRQPYDCRTANSGKQFGGRRRSTKKPIRQLIQPERQLTFHSFEDSLSVIVRVIPKNLVTTTVANSKPEAKA